MVEFNSTLKKRDQILKPDEYRDILSRHGKVLVYGQDWSALDFKSEVKKFVKATKTFKISEAKKLLISSDRLEVAASSYHSEPTIHSLLKKGKNWDSFKPQVLAFKNCVKVAKKNDVIRLLAAAGVDDGVRSFYEALLSNAIEDAANSDEEESC